MLAVPRWCAGFAAFFAPFQDIFYVFSELNSILLLCIIFGWVFSFCSVLFELYWQRQLGYKMIHTWVAMPPFSELTMKNVWSEMNEKKRKKKNISFVCAKSLFRKSYDLRKNQSVFEAKLKFEYWCWFSSLTLYLFFERTHRTDWMIVKLLRKMCVWFSSISMTSKLSIWCRFLDDV